MNDAFLPASLFTLQPEPGYLVLGLIVSVLTLVDALRTERSKVN